MSQVRRLRTSTIILLVVFVLTFAVYLAVRPDPIVIRDPDTNQVLAVRQPTREDLATTTTTEPSDDVPADPAPEGQEPEDGPDGPEPDAEVPDPGPGDAPTTTTTVPGAPGAPPGETTTTTTTTAPPAPQDPAPGPGGEPAPGG